ncbi:MAG: 4-(cytidine 5'-diphospho)-2-C-methyl-D-erythritol kinase [Vampirovibrionales bacterium]|nr:4-(cytidine 5'-diphospho)-2-C-methyl-D-erythritol kinase [Vampirovibrionales bacterium]
MTPQSHRTAEPSSRAFTLAAPAKINLFLNIRGLRDDGYHEILTVLQSLSLADQLTFEADASGDSTVHLTCDHPALQAEIDADPTQNLIVRAAQAFWQATARTPFGLRVHLEKRIPMAAGLGGGSADAAATLHALNLLCDRPHDLAALQSMARSLGADAPFMLTGGTAWADERGDRIHPLAAPGDGHRMLLVQPRDLAMPTALAYARARQRGGYAVHDPTPLLHALTHSQDPTAWARNDFEDVLQADLPAIEEIAVKLGALGLRRPLLCGSGSCMAGFFPPEGFATGGREGLNEAELSAFFPEDRYWRAICQTHPAPTFSVLTPSPKSERG